MFIQIKSDFQHIKNTTKFVDALYDEPIAYKSNIFALNLTMDQ